MVRRYETVPELLERGFRIRRHFLIFGLMAALLAFPAEGVDLAAVHTPGTPPPNPFPDPGPAGGSGSGRWQFATPVGLFVVDPAAGEIALQGATSGSRALVIVNLNKAAPPSDTIVTLNGVRLIPAFGSPTVTGSFEVDKAGTQPPVGTGGFIQLVVSSVLDRTQRSLILPCPSDVAMTSVPPIGSNLAGQASVQIGFASNIFLNPTNPPIPALAGGPFPTATLLGYDPIAGSIPFGPSGVALVGAGQLGVTVPIDAPATTSQYLMDVRWPGFWQPDGETGGFCGLAKRWTYLNSGTVVPVSHDEIVPVVLKLSGIGTIFSSELTLANTGSAAVDLTLTYTSETSIAAGTSPSSGSLAQRVEAGQQVVIGDVIAFLKNGGVPVAVEDVGTLRVSYTSANAAPTVFAQARTTSPSGIGRAGVGYGAPSTTSLSASKVAVFGLRQNSSDRSNMALLNAGQAGPATFRVTLKSGDPGDPRSVTLTPDVTLQAGEWRQLNGVLGQAVPPMTNGYATVERVSGTAPFLAYGVVNDNGTNDGSFIEMSAGALPAEPLVVPVVVETPAFETELTMTNPGAADLVATLSYVESLSAGGVPATPVTVGLLPGEQRTISKVIDFLRTHNAGIGPTDTSHAGSLTVVFTAAGVPAAGWSGARVTTAAAGAGRYGVSYAGVPLSASAVTEAFVTGLHQDGGTRSNLAFVNVGDVGGPVTLTYEVFDGATMQKAGQATVTLPPGGWLQKNQVLADFGVSNGYVHVLKVSGSDRFIAYGVVNDGGPATPGTNDGSVVTMAGTR